MGLLNRFFGRKETEESQDHMLWDLDLSQGSLGLLAIGMKAGQIKQKLGPPASSWAMFMDKLWIYPSRGFAVGTDRYKIQRFVVAMRHPQFRDFKRCTRKFVPYKGRIIFTPDACISPAEINASLVKEQLGVPVTIDVVEDRIIQTFDLPDHGAEFEFTVEGLLAVVRYWRID